MQRLGAVESDGYSYQHSMLTFTDDVNNCKLSLCRNETPTDHNMRMSGAIQTLRKIYGMHDRGNA